MSLSTHVLDSVTGRPAPGVPVRLERFDAGEWAAVAAGETDGDGRLRDWIRPDGFGLGTYRLVFDTGRYFATAGVAAFYPEVVVTFSVADDRHHHVPLLLSPFAYSTYRGS
jgi:5-hydroxyisourate hydrolase